MGGNRLAKYVPDYVVFDFETTGTSWINDDIIEISAVKVEDGKVTDTFSSLVNPKRHIPVFATEVNGITDEMVKEAPDLSVVLPEFIQFFGKFVLVGHNIFSFDLKFLYRAADEILGQTIGNDYIDTLYMARSCLKQLKHHRLVDLADYFHISTKGAHRALNDCMMNQQCFEKMRTLQEQQEILVCPPLWRGIKTSEWKIR